MIATDAISHSEKLLAVTLANPEMIKAFQSGIPGNGKPFPDGAKMAKIHWNPKKHETFRTGAKGAPLEDPSDLFNSSLDGNTRRAINFHEGEKIDETALKALIRAAVKLNASRAHD